MIKVEVVKEFTLGEYYKLKNISRKSRNVEGKLFVGDVFECDEDMVKYLTGGNRYNTIFVKVIETIPEAVIEEKVEQPKTTKKSRKKKN